MGNICRSPSAEGFVATHLRRAGLDGDFELDSAGTHGYHVGNPPDERAVAAALAHDVDIGHLRARRITVEDFQRFDHIIAMDRQNLDALQRLAPPSSRAELSLMMSHAADPDGEEVPDPYYGDEGDFRRMCELLDDAAAGFVRRLSGRSED